MLSFCLGVIIMGPLGTSRCHHLPGRARWWITMGWQSYESHRKPTVCHSDKVTRQSVEETSSNLHNRWKSNISRCENGCFFWLLVGRLFFQATGNISGVENKYRCVCERFCVPPKFGLVGSRCVWSTGIAKSHTVILPANSKHQQHLSTSPFRRQWFHKLKSLRV